MASLCCQNQQICNYKYFNNFPIGVFFITERRYRNGTDKVQKRHRHICNHPAPEMPARRGLGTECRHFPLTCSTNIKVYGDMKVTLVRKEVRGLEKSDLLIIDQRAKEEGTSTNELLRIVISDYAKRIREDDAAKVLHSYIDDLIIANNNVVYGLNENTVAIGEMFKTILSRIEMYFPDLNDEVARIQKNASPQEKNLSNSINFDEFE